MTKFVNNNIKNMSTSYILFELNYDYYPCISFENNIYPHLKFSSQNRLVNILKNFMSIC